MVDLNRTELVARRASLVAARTAIDTAITALDSALQNKPPQPSAKPRGKARPGALHIVGAPKAPRERKPANAEPPPERPDRTERRHRDVKAYEHTVSAVLDAGERGLTVEQCQRVFNITRAAARLRLIRLAQMGLLVEDARGVYRGAPGKGVADVKAA